MDEIEQLQRAGDDKAMWGRLLESYRPRLRQMLQLRIQGRLQGRIDSSDVIQEAYLDATRRLPEFLEHRRVPFYVWLRGLAEQRMAQTLRRHLGAQARDARREVSLYEQECDAATSAVLAARLVAQWRSPSSAAALEEQRHQLLAALANLGTADREILALRHFEGLTTTETAAVLGLSVPATCNRYVRALTRLKQLLPGLDLGRGEANP